MSPGAVLVVLNISWVFAWNFTTGRLSLRTVAALKYSTDRDGANGYRIPFKLLGLCLLEWAMPLYDKVINTSILLVILNHTALVIF